MRPRSRRAAVFAMAAALSLVACDQLGNPPQYVTSPTSWQNGQEDLITTSRSFRDENTILRLASEGLQSLDHADPSIGPEQTLTIVSVVPRRLLPTRRGGVVLVTVFELEGRKPEVRRWPVSTPAQRWTGAFALPSPPTAAVTSLAP